MGSDKFFFFFFAVKLSRWQIICHRSYLTVTVSDSAGDKESVIRPRQGPSTYSKRHNETSVSENSNIYTFYMYADFSKFQHQISLFEVILAEVRHPQSYLMVCRQSIICNLNFDKAHQHILGISMQNLDQNMPKYVMSMPIVKCFF